MSFILYSLLPTCVPTIPAISYFSFLLSSPLSYASYSTIDTPLLFKTLPMSASLSNTVSLSKYLTVCVCSVSWLTPQCFQDKPVFPKSFQNRTTLEIITKAFNHKSPFRVFTHLTTTYTRCNTESTPRAHTYTAEPSRRVVPLSQSPDMTLSQIKQLRLEGVRQQLI